MRLRQIEEDPEPLENLETGEMYTLCVGCPNENYRLINDREIEPWARWRTEQGLGYLRPEHQQYQTDHGSSISYEDWLRGQIFVNMVKENAGDRDYIEEANDVFGECIHNTCETGEPASGCKYGTELKSDALYKISNPRNRHNSLEGTGRNIVKLNFRPLTVYEENYSGLSWSAPEIEWHNKEYEMSQNERGQIEIIFIV